MPLRISLNYTLPAPPERVWPIVANTDRLNRTLGLPPTVSRPLGEQGEVNRRIVQATMFGLPVEFEEEPFEWVEPRRYWVVRHFTRGPFLSFSGGATLVPVESGTELQVEAEFEPRTRAGRALFAALRRKSARDWNQFARRIEAHLAGEPTPVYGPGIDTAPPPVQRQVAAGLAAVPPALAGEPLAQRLLDHLAGASDLDLVRMRPFRLAREWGVDRYELLQLFLRATRAQLLDLSWDLVCPNCRGGDFRAPRLEQLKSQGHCESCHIVYDANFDRFVEATFRPNPRLRAVEVPMYCMAGPRSTPHIVAQLVLAAGAERTLVVSPPPGKYRLRTLTGAATGLLEVAEGGAPEGAPQTVAACVTPEAMELALPDDPAGAGTRVELIAGPLAIALRNETSGPVQLILERATWDDECATAAVISVFQEFRDLFGAEALSPDVQLGIESLPLMFTDLKGSTELYQRLGDAPAFAVVRDHFNFLEAAIRARGGGVIKTIGDSAMAAFPTAAGAVDCALAVQRGVAAFNRAQGRGAIVIKLGLHQGPCIAVRANDRLDYFGTTVNVAARLHGQSQGGDVILSDALYRDPTVQALLEGLTVTSFATHLRGIEGEQRLWRVEEIGD